MGREQLGLPPVAYAANVCTAAISALVTPRGAAGRSAPIKRTGRRLCLDDALVGWRAAGDCGAGSGGWLTTGMAAWRCGSRYPSGLTVAGMSPLIIGVISRSGVRGLLPGDVAVAGGVRDRSGLMGCPRGDDEVCGGVQPGCGEDCFLCIVPRSQWA